MARLSNAEIQARMQHKALGELLDNSQAFRKFLWTWMRDLGIFLPGYSRGSATDMAYEAGRRAAGLEVLHMLKSIRMDILAIIEREGTLLEDAAIKPSEDPYENLQDPNADVGDPGLLP